MDEQGFFCSVEEEEKFENQNGNGEEKSLKAVQVPRGQNQQEFMAILAIHLDFGDFY